MKITNFPNYKLTNPDLIQIIVTYRQSIDYSLPTTAPPHMTPGPAGTPHLWRVMRAVSGALAKWTLLKWTLLVSRAVCLATAYCCCCDLFIIWDRLGFASIFLVYVCEDWRTTAVFVLESKVYFKNHVWTTLLCYTTFDLTTNCYMFGWITFCRSIQRVDLIV